MTLFAATLLGFALTDLVRGGTPAGRNRSLVAIAIATAAGVGLLLLAGLPCSTLYWFGPALAAVLAIWVLLEADEALGSGRATLALCWALVALSAAFGITGAVSKTGGVLKDWFTDLPIQAASRPGALDRATVGLTCALFLLASANRIVRLVLAIANTPTQKGETRLRGGRLIGPMERLFIGAMLVAGEPTGIAIVVAAKGLLRLPEIQKTEDSASVDEITEYFLIGTFASMLTAIGAAAVLLAIS